jgi:hypothetical protein
MQITRTSIFSGKTRTLDLPVTQEQLDRWQAGERIQDVMPDLTVDEREFLMTGAWEDEWDAPYYEDEQDI